MQLKEQDLVLVQGGISAALLSTLYKIGVTFREVGYNFGSALKRLLTGRSC